MKKFLKTFILAICLILPSLFCLTACGENKTAKVSSFSVELANTSYTLVDNTITVTYGEDYKLSANDFSVTATFEDETSKSLTSSELENFGFTFSSNVPESEKTPAGSYEISIKHKDIETAKTISLVVEKATINYSESDITWSESEFSYDGAEKTVTIANLPDTLKVTYQNNAKTNNGEYTLTATISAKDSDNYDFAEITVEHTWKIALTNYTITYKNTYELDNNNQTTYTLLSEKIILTDLTGRNYYTFDGWYLNDDKITEIPKGFTGGDITLQAKWTPIEYTVTYQDTKDVANTNPTTYTIEDGEITLAPLPNRVDYTFRYWERVYEQEYKVDVSPTTVISVNKQKGSITLKAVWDRKTEYDAFTYTVSKDCLKATITGLTNTSSTNITIPKGVVAIGNDAFKNCTTLSTVQFEEGSQLLTIGDYAFYYCGIQSITIPKTVTEIGDYAFSRSGISEMNFSSETSLATIGNYAFAECSYLTEFTIPDSVENMGQNVFDVCIGLTKIVFGKGMTVIGENIYGGSFVLREMEFKGVVTSFHKNALNGVSTGNVTLSLNWNQKYLEQRVYAIIGGGSGYSDEYFAESGLYREKTGVSDITQFCGKTFAGVCFVYNATNITADEFNSSLNLCSVGDIANFKFVLPASADNYFSAITTFISKYENGSVTLTIDGATSIPAEAFLNEGGRRLKEVVVGDSITSIGNNAFFACNYLQKVTFGKKLTTLGKFAFCDCKELTEVEIPDSVTSIGNDCFELCTKLESVKLSTSITELSDGVFKNCTSLKSLIIPDGVTEVGISAIQSCEALKSIVIPNSVVTISNDATYDCKALTTVYYAGTESEWRAISIGSYNAPLNSATIYYYSGTTPSGDGNYWHYDNNGNPTAW